MTQLQLVAEPGRASLVERWTPADRNTSLDAVELAQVIALGGVGAGADSGDARRRLPVFRGVAPRRSNGEQEMSHTLKLLIGLLALLFLPSLSACNTARGMGEDVQAVGKA